MSNLGVYFHVPFCVRKCNYCNFYSTVDDRKNEYVSAILRDVRLYNFTSIADTVFFGGGTPSLLCPNDIEDILSVLPLSSDAEISLEANPETVDLNKLKDYKKAGVSRISFGVQSFCDTELLKLGRIHSAERAERAIYEAQTAGFDNVNIDIMYALPGQDLKSLSQTVEKCLSFTPSHISLYGLKIERNTPFYRMKKGLNICDEDQESEMYFYICDTLGRNGYNHYEISNFAKQGFECKHNLKYWTRQEYVGFGPSAHSFLNGKRYYHKSDLESFIKSPLRKISEGRTKKRQEEIMLGLRLADGISLLPSEYETLKGFISLAESAKLLKYKDGNLRLTEKGFFVSNSIISELFHKLFI